MRPLAPASTDGILVLYHFIPPYAETVVEHALAFERHSRFPVWSVNTRERFPAALRDYRFRVIVLHYSLFGGPTYQLDGTYLAYLRDSEPSFRVAFFQDEHYHTAQRFAFVDQYRVDLVYTLLEPGVAPVVYDGRTHGPKLLSTIPGFVGDDLLRHAATFALPEAERTVDVGYRARSLGYAAGRGGQEKVEIGRRFSSAAEGLGLRLDIATGEADRLYGDAWYRFLGSCRAVLGVEAGVSIFDFDDEARRATDELLAREPGLSFEEVSRRVLYQWEDNVPYRTISPRHFEAAAFDTCQILFEGSYSGLMTAGTHYIPLRKDFANFEEVIRAFRDRDERARIVANAHHDLVDSGRYGYAEFIREFDEELGRAGIVPVEAPRLEAVDRALSRGAGVRRAESLLRTKYWRLRQAVRRSVTRSPRP